MSAWICPRFISASFVLLDDDDLFWVGMDKGFDCAVREPDDRGTVEIFFAGMTPRTSSFTCVSVRSVGWRNNAGNSGKPQN